MLEKWYQSIIEEVLQERVVSSRGRSVKRGVRQRYSNYRTRPWGPTNTVKNIDYEAAVLVKGNSEQGKEQEPELSLILENIGYQELMMTK
jgi:hypothetical protein